MRLIKGKKGICYKLLLIIAMIIIILSALFHTRITRVYHVMTLFNADKMAGNFRSMDSHFDTSVVHRGDSVHTLEYYMNDLPETYEYQGETKYIEDFLADTDTTGLIVIKDGRITFEEYYLGNCTESRVISWSVAKSIISALVGIAVEEGSIEDISDPVTKYVPSLRESGYDGIPIKDVLQMSTGIDFDEDYGKFSSDINRLGRAMAFNTSLDKYVASLEAVCPYGTYNNYISVNTQVLGMVIREATGKSLTDYLQEKIWRKIGVESDAYWLIDNKGMEMAFGGFNAMLRDYARFGLLYLNDGSWNGEEIISKEWIKASITPDAPYLEPGENRLSDSPFGYGYHWWIPPEPEGDYLAKGIYSQFIYVNPTYNVVIVKSSAYEDYNKDGTEKSIETVEVFRTITKSLSNQNF